MKAIKYALQACGLTLTVALLAACATNGGSQLPSVSQAPLATNKLQLAVGTANIGQDGTVGLNVVATLRQPSGTSAVLADKPTLAMPAGMLVPAGTPGAYGPGNVDEGKAQIS